MHVVGFVHTPTPTQAQDANRRLEAENSVIQTEAKELQARNTAMGAEVSSRLHCSTVVH